MLNLCTFCFQKKKMTLKERGYIEVPIPDAFMVRYYNNTNNFAIKYIAITYT